MSRSRRQWYLRAAMARMGLRGGWFTPKSAGDPRIVAQEPIVPPDVTADPDIWSRNLRESFRDA